MLGPSICDLFLSGDARSNTAAALSQVAKALVQFLNLGQQAPSGPLD